MTDLKIKELDLHILNIIQLEKYKSLFDYTREEEKNVFRRDKKVRELKWLKKTADECELVLDDEILDDYTKEDNKNYENEDKNRLLSKKRKKETKSNINQKKIYQGLLQENIPRSSFLTPDVITKLNNIVKNPKYENVNLTQGLFEAKKDLRSIKPFKMTKKKI
jgi:hypothetical protein